MRSDSGSGSILGVAIVGALLAVAVLVVPLGAVLATQGRARSVADAAALAAADSAIGLMAGAPCAAAAEVASAGGADLAGCVVDGVIATVRVSIEVGVWPVAATATAGPPP